MVNRVTPFLHMTDLEHGDVKELLCSELHTVVDGA